MEEKIEIVNGMIANGYHLFDETAEHFASRFNIETLKMFEKSFNNRK